MNQNIALMYYNDNTHMTQIITTKLLYKIYNICVRNIQKNTDTHHDWEDRITGEIVASHKLQ